MVFAVSKMVSACLLNGLCIRSLSLPQTVFAGFLCQSVYTDEQDDIDDVVEEPDGCRVAELGVDQADFIDVGRYYLTGADVQSVLHEISLLESNVHDFPDFQDEHHDCCRQNAGDVDVPDDLKLVCSIYLGGFI
ncbi:hypothetical protein SDC9_87388 [bioreactor metagenome]|uniref:Uncharacterized protein n=1 Tax=bioreactor metagenome TaxID=1076179 RepID=A0A644ZIP1_9ZZZZ